MYIWGGHNGRTEEDMGMKKRIQLLSKQDVNISATPNEFLCWFGVGSGGCLLEN